MKDEEDEERDEIDDNDERAELLEVPPTGQAFAGRSPCPQMKHKSTALITYNCLLLSAVLNCVNLLMSA